MTLEEMLGISDSNAVLKLTDTIRQEMSKTLSEADNKLILEALERLDKVTHDYEGQSLPPRLVFYVATIFYLANAYAAAKTIEGIAREGRQN